MLQRPDTIINYCIANGMLNGHPPKCLTDLNEVELALVSGIRIRSHIFSYYAGQGKSIKGWHSMFENNVDAVHGIANYVVNEYGSEEEYTNSNGKPLICVILTGPFTSMQHAKVMEQTKVSWYKIKRAIEWLKVNNRLYKHYSLTENDILRPIVIDKTEIKEGTNSNVENTITTTCVFPETLPVNETTGGLDSREDYKYLTLSELHGDGEYAKATLINKPSARKIHDYENDNLLRAFLLQFPYGVGNMNIKQEREFNTVPWFKRLTLNARYHFHKADFLCILYNMYCKKKLSGRARMTIDDDHDLSVKDQQGLVLGSVLLDMIVHEMQANEEERT